MHCDTSEVVWHLSDEADHCQRFTSWECMNGLFSLESGYFNLAIIASERRNSMCNYHTLCGTGFLKGGVHLSVLLA